MNVSKTVIVGHEGQSLHCLDETGIWPHISRAAFSSECMRPEYGTWCTSTQHFSSVWSCSRDVAHQIAGSAGLVAGVAVFLRIITGENEATAWSTVQSRAVKDPEVASQQRDAKPSSNERPKQHSSENHGAGDKPSFPSNIGLRPMNELPASVRQLPALALLARLVTEQGPSVPECQPNRRQDPPSSSEAALRVRSTAHQRALLCWLMFRSCWDCEL